MSEHRALLQGVSPDAHPAAVLGRLGRSCCCEMQSSCYYHRFDNRFDCRCSALSYRARNSSKSTKLCSSRACIVLPGRQALRGLGTPRHQKAQGAC